MAIQMTVVGLGQIGTSIGLALAEHKDKIARAGVDRELTVSKKAQKLGAIDKTYINLQDAVVNADLVVLAVPVDDIEDTLRAIAPELKSGAVIFDTSPVCAATAELAVSLLPEERYYVSIVPALNPIYLDETTPDLKGAHADLFHNSLVVITCPINTDPAAIQLATDFVTLLGAKPYFSDAVEVDGLMAAADLLPKISAAALVLATIDQPGWRETRKLARRPYARASSAVMDWDEYKTLGKIAGLNRENALRVIDDLISALRSLRDLIEEKDEKGLHDALRRAQDGRLVWLKQRQTQDWEIGARAETPTMGEVLGRLVGYHPRPKKNGK